MEPVVRMGDEDRFELAMSAASRERGNRPLGMAIIAAAALLLAGAAALGGLRSRAVAQRDYRQEHANLVLVERMALEMEELQRREHEAPEGVLGTPLPNLQSTVEGFAVQAGLSKKPSPPTRERNPLVVGGGVVREYHYDGVQDQSLTALIEWIRLTTSEVPGMELVGLKLQPRQDGWVMSASFRRWERP